MLDIPTQPRDALISILGEQWWNGDLSIATLSSIVIKFDRWTREKNRRELKVLDNA